MRKLLRIVCMGAVMFVGSASIGHTEVCLSPANAAELVQSGQVMPFRAIWRLVSQEVSGHPVGSQLCQRDGQFAYIISVRDGAVIRNVIVNASRGNIISIR